LLFVVAVILVGLGTVRGGWAIALVATTGGIECLQTLFWLWYSQRQAVQVGAETLLGRIVEVAEQCRPYGHVRVEGELWRARCEEGADRGERVRIVGRDGLTLEAVRDPR
jgi:membrane-bound serine protease (ClpP class)